MLHFTRSFRHGSVAVIATLTLALALIAGIAPNHNAPENVVAASYHPQRNLGG